MQKDAKTWLIGVSGGPDSMALLSMCLEKNMSVAVAFVNYHVRQQAEDEEQYVRDFCGKHHVVCHVKNDPFTYNGNFEAAARKWRYDFFKACIEENGYAGLLLGHHEDDLLETYFMQEEKGIEPAYYGLKEDSVYEGIVVRRPLLSYTKQDLVSYCEEKGIHYFVDATNNEDIYTRNRIRHQIVEKLSRTERDLVLHEIKQKNAVKQERLCRIDAYVQQKKIAIEMYRKLDKEDRFTLLFELCKDIKHMSFAERKDIDQILLSKNDFKIPVGNQYIVQDNQSFFLYEEISPFCDTYASISDLKIGKYVGYLIEEGKEGINAVSVTEDDFPLTIRSFQKGDSINMRFGTKKVNRFFIDRKIPLYKRDIWPIVCNKDNEVILVPGLGCNVTHYSIKPNFNVVQYIEM